MADRLDHLSKVDPRDDPEWLMECMERDTPTKPRRWDPSEPKSIPPHMAAEPLFVVIAKAARAAGKGYLIDHLWACFDFGKNVLSPWRQRQQELELRQARDRRAAECE